MQFNEEKFSTLEEKTADALEMAAQANEEREAQASSTRISIILFPFLYFSYIIRSI
jgi:hypothetical protein